MIVAAGKRLVVKELEPEIIEKKSILIFPDKQEQMRAQVIAVGDEVDKNIDMCDIVYLPSDTGIPIQIDGERYLSIVENQILAAYKETACE